MSGGVVLECHYCDGELELGAGELTRHHESEMRVTRAFGWIRRRTPESWHEGYWRPKKDGGSDLLWFCAFCRNEWNRRRIQIQRHTP